MLLLSAASFLCVALLVWALVPRARVYAPRVDLGTAPRTEAFARGLSVRSRPLSPLLIFLGRFAPRFGRREDAILEGITYTGVRMGLEEFRGLKLFWAAAGCLAYVPLAVELRIANPLWVIVAGLVGFMAPDIWLRVRVQRRNRAITQLLPDVIDLLSLCVGAGLDFLGALNKVMLVKALRREPLIEELSIVMQEIKLGKRRAEALRAMAKRVNLPELSSLVRTLVQADRMGTPMSEVLSIHSDDVRDARFTRAERSALKAPIKILMPLIFFIMPSIALIVGAPIFIQFTKQNLFGR